MKQWIHIYTVAIIIMIATVWSSVIEKVIPGITYIETAISGTIIVLLVYLPVLIKMAESRTYKVVEATFCPNKGWEVAGISELFFMSEDHILDHFIKEGWLFKGAIGTDQSPIGCKKRYYYLYRNW